MKHTYTLVPLILVMLCGCSSYFKKLECDKTNWYQHAHEVAMSGRRLDQDARIQECRKAGSHINDGEMDRGFKLGMHNYCKVESALNAGSNGQAYNYDFCDTNMIPLLKRNHRRGIVSFCQPENAYVFASKGGIYENQCHHLDEVAYLNRYRKGRKIYLNSRLQTIRVEQREIASNLSSRRNSLRRIDDNLRRLDEQILSAEERYAKQRERDSLKQSTATTDGFSTSSLLTDNTEKAHTRRMERLESDRSELLRQRNQTSRDIQNFNSRQNQIQSELQQIQAELSALQTI
jgi:hypothetical protein